MHQCPQYSPSPYYQPGLIHVFGGLIGVTASALQGGARLIQTIVEGAIWHGAPCFMDRCHHPDRPHAGCCAPHPAHGCCCCHVECVPPFYTGCHPC